jgi:hypothetical protein
VQPRPSLAVPQTCGAGNPAGQVAALIDQMHHWPTNGAGGDGEHCVPSGHEIGEPARSQASPAVAHTGGESVGAPPAGEHAPTLAGRAFCSKTGYPDTDVHTPGAGVATASGDPGQPDCVE